MNFQQNMSEIMMEYIRQSQNNNNENYYSDHGDHSDNYNDQATTY